jgi:hypothetical protein
VPPCRTVLGGLAAARPRPIRPPAVPAAEHRRARTPRTTRMGCEGREHPQDSRREAPTAGVVRGTVRAPCQRRW